MNRFSALREFLQANLYTLFALIVILAAIIGYILFFSANIGPTLQKRDQAATQLNDARRQLVEAKKIPEARPDDLQTRTAYAQATLDAAMSAFLSDAQASEIILLIYQSASASKVSITDLQTQPNPSPSPKDPYRITTIKLQAQGTSRQLMDFGARLDEIKSKSFIINNIGLTGDEKKATLLIEIVLYTIPMAAATTPVAVPGTPVPGATPNYAATLAALPTPLPSPTNPPTLTPTNTALPPTATPRVIVYTVVRGDTLFSIAQRYGVSVQAIMAANGMSNYNLSVGQQLRIPVP